MPSKPIFEQDSAEIAAKYDVVLGVQCPTSDATGFFAHPNDCRFYVNCWNGRPFVQSCAPGTLFNPESLECDFPNKVKCYSSELTNFAMLEHEDDESKKLMVEQSRVNLNNEEEVFIDLFLTYCLITFILRNILFTKITGAILIMLRNLLVLLIWMV